MVHARFGLSGVTVLIVANALTAQAPPSFAAPKDLGAGFDAKILGAAPAPVGAPATVPLPPAGSTAEAALAAEPKIWSGGAELGLSGSDGNSTLFKIRMGLNAKRTTADNTFTLDFLYGLSRLNNRLNEDKALLLLRDEVPLGGSCWSAFVADTVEYDRFRAYDFREALHAGVSRTWIKSDRTTFKTRFGAGVSLDVDTAVGGLGQRWVPEGMFGVDWDFKITDRQKIVSTVDYFPDLARFGQYRVRARAAYEILLDPAYGLVLRLGVQDRYDSSPGGAGIRRNDLDYFTALMLKF